MISAYSFVVTEWDKANGIGPQLLAQARKRLIDISHVNQDSKLDFAETQYYRGIYAEALSLVQALEKAGVSHG
jgi:hypothetical protein